MKSIISTMLATALLMTATASLGFSEYDKSLYSVGASAGDTESVAYFMTIEPLSQNCRYNVIYIEKPQSLRRVLYANILTAKSSNLQIRRLEYEIKDGLCYASLIEIR